jgi:NAD+-dependent protein deacetylase sirtuin 4
VGDDGNDVDQPLLWAVTALQGKRIAVLTGAGISTESGIPDYRGEGTRHRARNPIRFQDFMSSPATQRRYWARATVGWSRIRSALPNDAHGALAAAAPLLTGVLTQNVDGLHLAAGSVDVVELHGALRWVRCLQCATRITRDDMQTALLSLNPGFGAAVSSSATAPDGDVDLSDDAMADFVMPRCSCGGVYKPHVVFFGENVEADVLAAAWQHLSCADALLVIGTSLEVYSGRRFVERAHRDGKPIVIINQGSTRSDALATVRIDAKAGQVVPRLLAAIQGRLS